MVNFQTAMKLKLLKNKAKCKNCGTVIESKHRHDWVSCDCFEDAVETKGIFIDGGLDYQRSGGDPNNFIDMSEWVDTVHSQIDKIIKSK